jgi:hypothetical protein
MSPPSITAATPTAVQEYDSVVATIRQHLDGGRSGKGDHMKPAFHPMAHHIRLCRVGTLCRPIQGLFDRNDRNGPPADMQARIASIDI